MALSADPRASTNPLGSCPLGSAYGCNPSSTTAGPYQNTSVPVITSDVPYPLPSFTDPGAPISTGPPGGPSFPPLEPPNTDLPGVSDTGIPGGPTAGCPPPATVTVSFTETVTVPGGPVSVPSAPYPIPPPGTAPIGTGTSAPIPTGIADIGPGSFAKRMGRH